MYVNNDGNEGDSRDSNIDGNGEGNRDGYTDDAAAAANCDNVNEEDSGNLRTTIG